jgi:hypothetical protein
VSIPGPEERGEVLSITWEIAKPSPHSKFSGLRHLAELKVITGLHPCTAEDLPLAMKGLQWESLLQGWA